VGNSPSFDRVPFPSTHMSLVALAARQGQPGFREAWERFFQEYWPPLYAWLRRSGSPSEDARDLLQDFFLEGLDGPLLSRFDHSRGKLRSYLLTCLANQRKEAFRHQRARPDRHPLPFLDTERVEATLADPAAEDPMAAFDHEWAKNLFGHAVRALEEQFTAAKEVVSLRVLQEWVLKADRPPVESLAETLGITVGNLRVRGTRVKDALRGQIQAQVCRYAADEASADQEMEELLRILARGSER